MDELRSEIQGLIAGIIDFKGQQTCERVQDAIIYGGSAMAVTGGFVLQSFEFTVYAMAATVVAAVVASLPIPQYRQNELKWLAPPTPANTTSADVIVDYK